MGRVEGKVAFITGAARGQGRAHALRLATEGADIIAIDACASMDPVQYAMPDPAELDSLAKEIEALGRKVFTRVVDVRDGAAVEQAAKDGVQALGGRLDIVIANAGVWAVSVDEPTDPALRRAVWKTTLDINTTGVWNTVEAATPLMIAAGNGGAMVFTNSIQGMRYASNHDLSLTAYTASKHALVGLLRCTARDLGEHAIRVNSVHPTGVLTGMIAHETMGAYAEKHPRLGEVMGNILSAEAGGDPVPLVDLQDITEAVLYLVSDSGRYITGVTLPVDAGALLK
ncbi:MAG: mycofactocin-coupled SDR family oxidoreductase [Sporichthyaceae bacterium]